MSKLVKINDRKEMEIFLGRKTRGPIELRLSESVICRILNSLNAPKDIFAIGPNKETVRLTKENYMIPENELFAIKKVEQEKETSEKNDALKTMLENMQTTNNKVENVKSETIEVNDSTEDELVETTDEEPVQEVTENSQDDIEETESEEAVNEENNVEQDTVEQDTVDESVIEEDDTESDKNTNDKQTENVSNLNNHQNYYKKKNKNRR